MKLSLSAILLLLLFLMAGAWNDQLMASETGTITGSVYCDKDKNGTCDCEEDGLKDIHIQIYADHCGGIALHTVSTDQQGTFIFQEFEPGTYFVSADLDYVCGGRVPTTTICRQVALVAGETHELPAFGFSEYGQ